MLLGSSMVPAIEARDQLTLVRARQGRLAALALGEVEELIGATPFQWTVLGLRLSFLFAESFRS